MATISQILAYKWPGWEWSMSEDDYSTLTSFANEPVPKPTLAQVQSFSAETDAYLAQQARDERIRNALSQDGLRLFNVVMNLTKALRELRSKAALKGGQSLTASLDAALQAAETDLTNIQNAP